MLYSKCDIDFSAMGSKHEAENAIEFKGTLESAVHEVRIEMAIEQFFTVHEQCDFEEMALEAYVDAHGNEAILESNLTVIREAAESQEETSLLQRIKKKAAELPGIIAKGLATISEKLSGVGLDKLKEKVKGIKNVKVEMPDFDSWANRIVKAFESLSIVKKIIAKMKRGEKVTSEEVKEEMAKATGGDAKGGSKALMNVEKPEEKSQNVDGERFVDKVKGFAAKIGKALQDAGKTVKNFLADLPGMIKSVGAYVVGSILSIIIVSFMTCVLAITIFIAAVLAVVAGIYHAGKVVAGAAKDKAQDLYGRVRYGTRKDDGNFSGETVEA